MPHTFPGGQTGDCMMASMLDMIFFTEGKYYRQEIHECEGSGSVKPRVDGNRVTGSS